MVVFVPFHDGTRQDFFDCFADFVCTDQFHDPALCTGGLTATMRGCSVADYELALAGD